MHGQSLGRQDVVQTDGNQVEAAAIRGALCGGLVSTLITDTTVAKGLLE